MLRLRTGIVVLGLWFFLFYNVERLNSINIAGFVYLLVPASIALLLLAPRKFSKDRLIYLVVPVLLVYFALKLGFRYPIFGAGLPITVTEVCSIVISLLLARKLAYIVLEFEETVAKLTFRHIGLPPRLYESVDTEELYREVKRCRRFQHPLVMLLVEPEADPEQVEINRLLRELQESMAARYVQARLAKLLSEELRDCDLIAQHGKGFAVLLPEMTPDEADKFAQTVCSEASDQLGMDLRVGMGSFPDSALTLGGLLDAAAEDLSEHKVAAPAFSMSSAD
jgi:hypothetical protein